MQYNKFVCSSDLTGRSGCHGEGIIIMADNVTCPQTS